MVNVFPIFMFQTVSVSFSLKSLLILCQVSTYHDLSVALRRCVNACTLLANQAHLIKNTFALRASLIQHLLLEVVPLPLPCDSPPDRLERDWWAAQEHGDHPMRFETQADLLKLLALVAKHYSAVMNSEKNNETTIRFRFIHRSAE